MVRSSGPILASEGHTTYCAATKPAKLLHPFRVFIPQAPTVLHIFRTDMPAHDRKLTMDELDRPSPDANLKDQKAPVRLVLDDVRSRHNVGSIFRTADAFGAEGIILCGFTPQPPHREIEKTALGATLSVPWHSAPDALSAVNELKGLGYMVVAVEQTQAAVPLQELNIPMDRPMALVLGNELHGVSEAVVAAADACVIIPQHGSKHSLNVSVCAGVVLWWCSALPSATGRQPFPRIT